MLSKKERQSYLKDLTLEKFYKFIENQESFIAQNNYIDYVDLEYEMRQALHKEIEQAMIKPDIDYSKLVYKKIYNCVIQSCTSARTVDIKLKYVKEDDCSWRTADDNSELSNVWNIIKVLK